MRKYGIIIWTLLFFCVLGTYSQERRTEISIDFRVNKTVIDPTYNGNGAHLAEISTILHSFNQDSTIQLVEVAFCGAASPEGSYQVNRRLAHERLTTLERFVRQQINIPDSIITRNDSYIPWHYLRKEVAASDIPYKNEILDILDADSSLVDYHHINTHIDRRVVLLKSLYNGKAWSLLFNRYFKHMRNASAIFVIYKKKLPEVLVPHKLDTIPICTDTLSVVQDTIKHEPEIIVDTWNRYLHLKTNTIGWAMGITNMAAETDIVKHWSVTLPIYYSAWNYFTSTIKFRTFAIQPELRYWFSPENDGWFAGAHFGLAYYNFAFDDAYRYQDHNRETPAIGGGLAIGYRMPISKDYRWHIEFTIGGGAYKSHYDKFYNTPNTKDGLMVEDIHKTYWGIDKVSVTFSYALGLKRKGGKR